MRPSMSRRSTALVGAEGALLIVAAAVAAVTSTREDWEPIGLVLVLTALALGSDRFAVSHEGQRISGSFLALVLAMTLAGPAPAVAIGVTSVLVDHAIARNPLPRLITNLATFATFPLVGGLLARWAIDVFNIDPTGAGFTLLVLAVFIVTILLDFLMIAGDHCFHERKPLGHEFRVIFVPVLPSELISALLCALVASVYVRTGVAAMVLMVVVLVVFQYLLTQLLLSRERAERLAGMQIGVLTSMIETLALRDRMTARHPAAVARYAGALAGGMGWAPARPEAVPTPGALPERGKC